MKSGVLCSNSRIPVFLNQSNIYFCIENQPNNVEEDSKSDEKEKKLHIVFIEVVEKEYGKNGEDAKQAQEMMFRIHDY
jgi:alanine dehydrogenase